jgi:hypothetical protein
MLALANVVHFFPHKFPGLSRCRFALPSVTPGPLESLFFWHKYRCRSETIPLHYPQIAKPHSMGSNPVDCCTAQDSWLEVATTRLQAAVR